MRIIKEGKIKEFLDVKNLDKLRYSGSLSGWQRQIYTLITVRFASSILDRMMVTINKMIPDDADHTEVKNTLVKAFIDYFDTVL